MSIGGVPATTQTSFTGLVSVVSCNNSISKGYKCNEIYKAFRPNNGFHNMEFKNRNKFSCECGK